MDNLHQASSTTQLDPAMSHCSRLLSVLALLIWHATAFAQDEAALRDGQRDFDFTFGTWHSQLSLLLKPLSGSTTWAEYEGTTVVREIWGGRANLVEFDVSGPAGRIELLSLRLYNPQSRQWSLHAASSRTGTLFPPVVGEFTDGRGEFFGVDTVDGRTILARFVITQVSPDTLRFEQAFSDDGGKTWETNWIAVDTRIRDATNETP